MTDHLIIDVDGARQCLTSDTAECLRQFLLSACRQLGMKPLGEPIIYAGSSHLPGYTGFLVIETSHISIHQFDSGSLRIDVYSCKPFKADVVLALLDNYFIYDLINTQCISRWPVKEFACGTL